MEVNLSSMLWVTQAALPFLAKAGQASIVNLSSLAGRKGGHPGSLAYSTAKGAVLTWTRALAAELAPQGIRVNAVSPGTVDNYFHEQFSTRQVLDNVVLQTPAGRLAANEDVADVIVFLCSDAARYVHGQTIEVNGGMLAP